MFFLGVDGFFTAVFERGGGHEMLVFAIILLFFVVTHSSFCLGGVFLNCFLRFFVSIFVGGCSFKCFWHECIYWRCCFLCLYYGGSWCRTGGCWNHLRWFYVQEVNVGQGVV